MIHVKFVFFKQDKTTTHTTTKINKTTTKTSFLCLICTLFYFYFSHVSFEKLSFLSIYAPFLMRDVSICIHIRTGRNMTNRWTGRNMTNRLIWCLVEWTTEESLNQLIKFNCQFVLVQNMYFCTCRWTFSKQHPIKLSNIQFLALLTKIIINIEMLLWCFCIYKRRCGKIAN